MTDGQEPTDLVPSGCDLRDFAFMPLQVERLRRSKAWLKCKRNPALAFYMVNLWTASWHDVPAGSLEDDDDVLADLAMCEPSKWAKVKADALHGWVHGGDGRIYNPTVCEQARVAWDSKLDQRWRTECARIKKHADRHKIVLPRPTFDEWMSDGCPQGQRLYVPRDTEGTGAGQGGETASKRQGEGQGQGQEQREGQGQGDLVIGTGSQPGSPPQPPPPPGAEAPATRGKRLDRDWALPKAWGEWALRKYPHWTADIVRAIATGFRNHWVAKSGKDATKLDWLATWENWCDSDITQRQYPAPKDSTLAADEARAASHAKAERLLSARRAAGAGAVVPAAELVDRQPSEVPELTHG